jgi:hypothetical protein
MMSGCDVKPGPFGIAVPHLVQKEMISSQKKGKEKKELI